MSSAVGETRVLATEREKARQGELRSKGHLDGVQKPPRRRARIVAALALAALVALVGALAVSGGRGR
jgi:hypothetical protein